MKVIIIEGPDNTGKNTLIQNLIDNNKVVKIIHCDKPISIDDPFSEQMITFSKYAYDAIKDNREKNIDVLIFNRYYQGEYVYGQMYRNGDKDKIKWMINEIEKYLLKCIDEDDIYYVQLLSTSPKLLKRNDDGKSLSGAELDKIEKEVNLFKEVFDLSILKNKHIIYINDGDEFRTREDILIEFNDFMNVGY